MKPLSIGALIFEGFELLDMFGPLEMYGMYPEQFEINMVGLDMAATASAQGPRSLPDHDIDDHRQYDILLVPGGRGTRTEIDNTDLITWLRQQSASAQYITSVCTGSVLLAAAGLLNNRRATTNKNAFEWVSGFGDQVDWIKQARWVVDENIHTSSGVSAGIDMSLAVIEKVMGHAAAVQAAQWGEYEWHQDPDWDPFAKLTGLVD